MSYQKGRYAWTVTVGEKGQIVIPKQARDIFDIKPGDRLVLLGDDKRGIAIPPKDTFTKYAEKIFGVDDLTTVEDNFSTEFDIESKKGEV